MGYIAIAIGFGIVTGVLFIVRGEIGPGLLMLGFTIFIAAVIFAPSAATRFLIISIAAVVCSGALVYSAVRSEITGKTVEYYPYGRVLVAHPVTRLDSPEKFRQCTNWRWALGVGFLGIGVITFRYYRKLESADWL